MLVAGATGFFGGWLVRGLLDRRANVVCIVRPGRKLSQFVLNRFDARTIVETGTLYDAAFLARVFERHRFDVFFHAAYGADVTRVLREPVECFRSSVESTWVCLDLIRRLQPSCAAIISSTDKAYGTQALPYRETNPLTPIHPYEVAKASQDLAAQSFGKTYRLPVAITRCGNYYGPYDFNFSRLIPGVCRSLAAGEAPVLRSDGRFTRDFLYVEDAVDAQLLLAQQLTVDASLYGEAFNFSYGDQLEVLEIVRRIARLAGTTLEPVIADATHKEIRHMHLSSAKAQERLNWKPRVGFDEGLRRTVEWYRTYLAGQGTVESA